MASEKIMNLRPKWDKSQSKTAEDMWPRGKSWKKKLKFWQSGGHLTLTVKVAFQGIFRGWWCTANKGVYGNCTKSMENGSESLLDGKRPKKRLY